jgi:hypothetical protein
LSEKPIALSARSPSRFGRQAVARHDFLGRHDLGEPLQEPGIVMGDGGDVGDAELLAQRLRGDQQPVGRRARQGRLDLV